MQTTTPTTAQMLEFCRTQAKAKGPGFFADMVRRGPSGWTPAMADAILRGMAKAALPAPAAVAVADGAGMDEIAALFANAKKSGLQRPSFLIETPAAGRLKLSLAGEGAKVPGSINVAEAKPFGQAQWFGRVTQAGEFQPSHKAPPAIADALRTFAADPCAAAAAYGRLTGHCCFCSKTLTDPVSVDLGYGPVCAKKWGLQHKPVPVCEAA